MTSEAGSQKKTVFAVVLFAHCLQMVLYSKARFALNIFLSYHRLVYSRHSSRLVGFMQECGTAVPKIVTSPVHIGNMLIVDINFFFFDVFSLSLGIAIHHLGPFITSVLCLKLQRAQKNCICRVRLKDSVEPVGVTARIRFTHLSHFVQ